MNLHNEYKKLHRFNRNYSERDISLRLRCKYDSVIRGCLTIFDLNLENQFLDKSERIDLFARKVSEKIYRNFLIYKKVGDLI